MRSLRLLAIACLTFGVNGRAGDNAKPCPVLVELFTSEGCSSCPPADAALEKLDSSQPIPGALLIVLSEHVDYWNHDGWKDPYSSLSFTNRQNAYARALGIGDIYTPQFIVDGSAELHLNKPQQAEQILEKAAAKPTVAVRIDSVKVENESVQGRIEIGENPANRDADIFLAIALNHADSEVLRGENKGRHLSHVAVVESLKKIGKLPSGGSFAEDFHAKLKPNTELPNIRIIAFVQEPGPGKVLGAAVDKPPFQ